MKTQIIAILSVVATLSAIAATPIHHYDFNGATVADTVGTANGTLLNGASVTGGMLQLDGVNDYVQFAQMLVPTSGPFSVAFFARENSPTTDPMEMISQGSTYGPGFYVGKYSGTMRIGDSWQSTGVNMPSVGVFHHYAVTMDGATTRLYIDGLPAASTGAISIANTGDFTRLGRQFYYPLEPIFGPEMFHGDMDELWIYTGALTATEVAGLAVIPEPSSFVIVALGFIALTAKCSAGRKH
jgi:hypothetical protein